MNEGQGLRTSPLARQWAVERAVEKAVHTAVVQCCLTSLFPQARTVLFPPF